MKRFPKHQLGFEAWVIISYVITHLTVRLTRVKLCCFHTCDDKQEICCDYMQNYRHTPFGDTRFGGDLYSTSEIYYIINKYSYIAEKY